MALAEDCADVNAVDFSYPFLRGIDAANPPSSITIPQKYLDAMGNMERQYWELKADRYNVMIFFKKGKFYELYDYDAVIANKEFGLKMVFDTTNRGKMRLAGVPEQSLSEWARLFVFRGYKVGRVEQMVRTEENSPGAAKAKIVPRELVEVLTPGTLSDAAMLSDHNEVFLVAFAPQPESQVVDAFAVDLSRHVVYWCPCGDAAAVARYRQRYGNEEHPLVCKLEETEAAGTTTSAASSTTGSWVEGAMRSVTALLQQLHPREVVVPSVGTTTTDKAQVKSLELLTKWIQSDGVAVEAVPVQPEKKTAGTDGGDWPTARETVTQYLRSLKLEHALPLLDDAAVYQAHLTSTNAAADAASPPRAMAAAARPNAGRVGGLLAWERRFAAGLVLDSATVSNLELVSNLLDGTASQSLHQCLNRCVTNGGKRLFRAWLLRPSASARVIRRRQECVRFMLDHHLLGNSELWSSRESGGAASSSVASTPRASGVGPLSPDPSSPSTLESTPGPASASQQSFGSGQKRPREPSGSAHFHARFANMLAVDFERSLSRLAEIKTDLAHQTISYVDPLVRYRKNLDIILSTVQAFSEMVDWATQFHAMCRRQLLAAASQGSAAGTRGSAGSQTSAAGGEGALPLLLAELLHDIEAAAESVTAMERLFDRHVAAETGRLTPAPGTSAEYDQAAGTLAALEEKLDAYRAKAQAEVFGGATTTFVDLGKDLFLLEVAAAYAPRMTPAGMVERARSGKSVKYSVDALCDLVDAHKEATAAKATALLNVLQSVAAKVCEQSPRLFAATGALSYLDCLLNLASLPGRYANMCFPDVVGDDDGADTGAEVPLFHDETAAAATEEGSPDRAFLAAKDLVHPLLTATQGSGGGGAAVPNSVTLSDSQGRLLLLTGPNMAGKSTVMRTVAVGLLMAQLGGPVLGSSMRFSPVDRIYTRIGARDATQKGQSTLFVELNEAAEILRSATGRSLCLIDELGRGTSTHDGLAIAHATLQALRDAPAPPLTIFSTHYHSLAQEQMRRQREGGDGGAAVVQLGYMDFALLAAPSHSSRGDAGTGAGAEAQGGGARAPPVPEITFLYSLVPGVCDRSYGVEVALMAGVSPALVELARDKSRELAMLTALHEDTTTVRAFLQAPQSS